MIVRENFKKIFIMICLLYGVLEKKLKNFIMGSVKKIDLFIVVNIRIYYILNFEIYKGYYSF